MDSSITTAMPADRARVEVKHPGLAMVSMLIGAFMGMFSETALNIALPSLATSLNVPTSMLSWLVTGYMLVIGIVLPFSSLLTRWFTTRQLIITGLIAFIVGAAIAATAGTFPILLLGGWCKGLRPGLSCP